MRTFTRQSAVLLICLLGGAAAVRSQTLAQRNWAGSGVSAEAWWRRAVFYRIDPAEFQDSNNDGKGDLAGVAQRLDYLQALGVDALILDASGASIDDGKGLPSPEGFDDLTRASVSHHLRVLVTLGVPASQAPAADAQYLALARSWLNQGAAGVYVPTRALQQVDGTAHIGVLLHQLRLLTNSFPGGRVLLAGAPATADTDLARALLKETHLTASAAITTKTVTVAGLRMQLEAALSGPPGAAAGSGRGAPGTVNPMLTAERVGPQKDAAAQDAVNRTVAAMLLASRAAVILEYGQELGLATVGGKAAVMQWTPSNVTLKPPPPAKPDTTPPPPKPAFQSFHEFVPPPRKDLLPPPRMPLVIESDDPQPVITDLNVLPGFTGGALDASLTASNGATANVALEQGDAKSLLSLYRQLLQLHHDNPAVRNGTQTLLNFDADNALVWQRRPAAGSHSAATVVVACRLGASTPAAAKVVRSLIGMSGDAVVVSESR